MWQKRSDEINTGRNVYWHIPKVSEKKAWTNRLLNWPITGHGPFPDYFLRFRVKPVTRRCPFCTSPNPVTNEHLLVEWIVWEQAHYEKGSVQI